MFEKLIARFLLDLLTVGRRRRVYDMGQRLLFDPRTVFFKAVPTSIRHERAWFNENLTQEIVLEAIV